MAVKTVPDGRHSVTPRLFVSDAPRLVEFMKYAFGATGSYSDNTPSDIRIGDSIVMVSGTEFRAANEAYLYVYVEDADAAYRRALEKGATSVEEPSDQFYGDRRATVRDSWGNTWQIATHKEDLSLEEIQKRAAALAR